MKPLQPINPRKEPLTIEKLRTFQGFETVSDEEAARIIDTIYRFAMILHRCYCHQYPTSLKSS